VRLFSNRSQMRSKCGKNISDTSAIASCATFLFLPLTSSVIYHWTDARQHGIYLLNVKQPLFEGKRTPLWKLCWFSFLLFAQKLVISNKDVLMNLRTSFDKPDQCMELLRRLKSMQLLAEWLPSKKTVFIKKHQLKIAKPCMHDILLNTFEDI